MAEHGHPGAEIFHVLQLVGNEKNRFPFMGEPPQGAEQELFLLRGDPRGGFVQDEQARSHGQEPKEFQLLAFPEGEAFQGGFGVEGKAEIATHPF